MGKSFIFSKVESEYIKEVALIIISYFYLCDIIGSHPKYYEAFQTEINATMFYDITSLHPGKLPFCSQAREKPMSLSYPQQG